MPCVRNLSTGSAVTMGQKPQGILYRDCNRACADVGSRPQDQPGVFGLSTEAPVGEWLIASASRFRLLRTKSERSHSGDPCQSRVARRAISTPSASTIASPSQRSITLKGGRMRGLSERSRAPSSRRAANIAGTGSAWEVILVGSAGRCPWVLGDK